MKKRQKYLDSLPLPLQKHIFEILQLIYIHKRTSLDIKALHGKENMYRCRYGKIRIIFEVKMNTVEVIELGPRGDVYK